jgi:transposase
MSKIIAIDVSKQTLDVAYLIEEKWQHFSTTNDVKGFTKIVKLAESDDWFVMEASGPYYLPLASYLFNKSLNVSVINPLIIRRFSQMKLYRAKTDKKDAKTIAEYAMGNDLKKWSKAGDCIIELQQLLTAIQLLHKHLTQSNGQLEAFTSSGELSKELSKDMKTMIKSHKMMIAKLEGRLKEVANAHYKETLDCLQSIPGIGIKTAIQLTIVTDNFKKFENYKQLTAYVGLSPRIFQSGTSVKGKGHICKMGNPQVRKLLYMCSWTAKKCNSSCKEMYDRLKAKGKPERVIKIAIANKLLKQAFAIATTQTMYEENYIR